MIESALASWWWQRLTAVYAALFTLIALPALWIWSPGSAEGWAALMGRPPVAVASLLYLIAILWHTWIGMRDVLMDYVHRSGWRLLATGLVAVWLWACGIWGAAALLRGVV